VLYQTFLEAQARVGRKPTRPAFLLKPGELREVAGKIPLDRLLVETDSPYLAPVPYRGSARRNEPAFVVETARVLAGIRGLSLEDLAGATTRNFAGLFPFEKTGGEC
jgi:TatD DNase family protein